MKKSLKVLLTIEVMVLLAIGGIGIETLLFPQDASDQSMDTAYLTIEKTTNDKNVIDNQEWFVEQEAYIRQCLKNESLAQEKYELYFGILSDDRTTWDMQEKQKEEDLLNNFFYLQKLTNEAIKNYNVKSENVNKNIFKDDLPNKLNREWYANSMFWLEINSEFV